MPRRVRQAMPTLDRAPFAERADIEAQIDVADVADVVAVSPQLGPCGCEVHLARFVADRAGHVAAQPRFAAAFTDFIQEHAQPRPVVVFQLVEHPSGAEELGDHDSDTIPGAANARHVEQVFGKGVPVCHVRDWRKGFAERRRLAGRSATRAGAGGKAMRAMAGFGQEEVGAVITGHCRHPSWMGEGVCTDVCTSVYTSLAKAGVAGNIIFVFLFPDR